MIGKTIGKYRIVGQLGRGGMGTVYKAVDETLDREVAIKVLNPELADSDILKRFRAEATTLAKLNHPEIATIFELFWSETDLLMVMEFVKGETLDKLSDRVGPLPPEQAAYLIDKVLSALEHAHRAGVVHRDMKPANVMVTETGGVKIMDFGIARVRGADHMTVNGYMMGTPAYMPPEQVLGQDVDGRADLYSVGVVFYRLLTGSLPFKADTAIGMVQKQLSDSPTPLNIHRKGLPDWCETVLQRALTKSPADRYQTAEEFREALARATGTVVAEHTRAFSPDFEMTTPPVQLEALGVTPLGTPLAGAIHPAAPRPSSLTATGPTPALPARVPSAPKTASAPIALDGAIVLQKQHFAVGGTLLAVLVLGIAVLAYVALRRPPPAPPSAAPPVEASQKTTVETPATPAPVTPGPAAEPAAPAATPAGTPAAAPTPSATAIPSQPSSSTAGPAPSTVPARGTSPPIAGGAAAPAKPTPGERGPGPAVSAEARGTATAKPPSSAVPTKAFLPLALDARALVSDGNQQRERDARVFLADGKVTVTSDENPSDVIHALPYEGIVSISYSRGRDPLWNSPSGPAPVLRAGAGALGGIFRGARHWVTLRTSDARNVFIVLRFPNDGEVRRALTALQERTGKSSELVAEQKDAK